MSSSVKVRCGGVWLEGHFEVGDLRWSTRHVLDDYSGDYKATVRWSAPTDHSSPFVKAGAVFEILEHGLVLWGGNLGEPAPGQDGWQLFAYGYGNRAQWFPAITNIADEGDPPVYAPSTVPNDVVDTAIELGAPWTRLEDLGDDPVYDPDGQISDVLTLLTRAAQALGKRVHFDSHGEITFATDPVAPVWTVGPGESYMGTADDTMITRLYGFYAVAGGTVIKVTVAGFPTGGVFELTGNGDTTPPLGYDATGAEVQTAVQGLGGVFADATVEGPVDWVYTVTVSAANAELTVSSALTGGTNPGVTAIGSPPNGSVTAVDDEAATQYGGHRARTLRMFNLGPLTEPAAQEFIDGRFGLIGARMAPTNTVNLTSLNLRRLGADTASPRYVKAGQSLRIPGVMDTRLQPQTRASIEIVGGEVEYVEAEDRAEFVPVGFIDRGYDAVFAEPDKPSVTDA